MDHVGLLPSTVASEDELSTREAAGLHQWVGVSSVAEAFYYHGRSEHVHHSLLYTSYVLESFIEVLCP